MAGEALRSLLASFTVEVDKAGALAKGEKSVDSLALALRGLDAQANKTAASVGSALARVSSSLAKAASGGGLLLGAGGGGSSGGGPLAKMLGAGGADPFAAYHKMFGGAGGGKGGSGGSIFDRLTPGPDGLGRLGSFVKSLGTMQNVLAAAGVTAGFVAVKGLVENIGNIGEAAQKLGVTNAEFQRLDVLAKQNSTSVGALGTAFRTLAGNAVSPSKEATEAFQQLNVATKAGDGSFKSRQDLFFETAGALADVADETRRADLAQKLYGRSGLELLPLLANGRAGLEEQRAALEKLPVVTDDVIKAADDFGDQWEAMKLKLMATAGPVLMKVVIPALNGLMAVINTAADAVGKLDFKNIGLAAGLVLLVPKIAALATQLRLLIDLGGGAKGLFSGIASGVKALRYSTGALVAQFLLLEDIFTFFTGGDSLTGRGIEAVFGRDVAEGVKKAAADMTAAFKELWYWITGGDAAPHVKQIYEDVSDALDIGGHDLQVALGLRNGEYGRTASENADAGVAGNGLREITKLFGGVDSTDPFAQSLGKISAQRRMAVPGGGGGTTITDARTQSVQINMGNASPADVAKRVGVELNRDRNAIAAGVP